MITKIGLSRFKPFSAVELPLRPLTLVMGENGVGKSSISQGILLLKQAFLDDDHSNLPLNGELVRIGNGVDALNQTAERDDIDFSVTWHDNQKVSINAKYLADSDLLPMTVNKATGLARLRKLKVSQLGANRVGPQLISRYSSSETASKQISEDGSNALALLHAFQGQTFDKGDPRINEKMASRSLISAFDYYLSQISNGASIDIADLSNIDSVSATYSFSESGSLPSSKIRPTNVGFGLSYAASIIVVCLLSVRGDLLIIENPEAHLHTKGQRALTELLALTAKSGVQILCETHSREIFYFLRKMMRDGIFDENSANMLYVHQQDGQKSASEWFPLTKAFHELGQPFESFLEHFGAPMDFVS